MHTKSKKKSCRQDTYDKHNSYQWKTTAHHIWMITKYINYSFYFHQGKKATGFISWYQLLFLYWNKVGILTQQKKKGIGMQHRRIQVAFLLKSKILKVWQLEGSTMCCGCVRFINVQYHTTKVHSRNFESIAYNFK